jgi:hypothetical protein
MVEFAIDRDAQGLKRARRRMETGVRRTAHDSFNDPC